jgi:hypothetical protein
MKAFSSYSTLLVAHLSTTRTLSFEEKTLQKWRNFRQAVINSKGMAGYTPVTAAFNHKFLRS